MGGNLSKPINSINNNNNANHNNLNGGVGSILGELSSEVQYEKR